MEKVNDINVKDFFTEWFYISIIFVLGGIICSSFGVEHNQVVSYIINLISNLFQSIGLAIFVANIFTFIIGTNQFLKYVRDRLVNIVVSKEFITTLNQEEQQKLLHLALRPSKVLSSLYSGINDYFNNYIQESLKLFNSSYRGHLSINALASYNNKKNCIQIIFDMDYIVYKVAEKFEPMPIYFEDGKSEHIHTIIKAHEMEKEVISQDMVEEIGEVLDPSLEKGYIVNIPEKFNSKKQIHVNRKLIEYGDDHWQIFSYKSIRPYDGMIVNLTCEDNIIIKCFNTYGKEDDFTVEKEEKRIKIQYHDWLTSGFGVNVVVAVDKHHECPKFKIDTNGKNIYSCVYTMNEDNPNLLSKK